MIIGMKEWVNYLTWCGTDWEKNEENMREGHGNKRRRHQTLLLLSSFVDTILEWNVVPNAVSMVAASKLIFERVLQNHWPHTFVFLYINIFI